MARPKTILIWEGPHGITITKAYALKQEEQNPYMYHTKVKQKGIFSPYISVHNIDEMYIGTPKKLCVGDKTLEGWNVIHIRKDFTTHDPFFFDVPPAIIAQIKSLRNECEIWKKKYYDAKKLNEDRTQKDRFQGRVLDEAEFMAKVKNKFWSQDNGWSGGFARNWLSPSPSLPSSNTEE